MKSYQQRVVNEKTELDNKMDKLAAFIDTPNFAALGLSEQERIVRQYHHMGNYTAVLGERISAF